MKKIIFLLILLQQNILLFSQRKGNTELINNSKNIELIANFSGIYENESSSHKVTLTIFADNDSSLLFYSTNYFKKDKTFYLGSGRINLNNSLGTYILQSKGFDACHYKISFLKGKINVYSTEGGDCDGLGYLQKGIFYKQTKEIKYLFIDTNSVKKLIREIKVN